MSFIELIYIYIYIYEDVFAVQNLILVIKRPKVLFIMRIKTLKNHRLANRFRSSFNRAKSKL